jgi:hypothetical protein
VGGAVVVGGALANKPGSGGEAWVRLSWILGLRDLGVDVRFVEQISPETCVDAAGATVDAPDSVNATWFRQVTEDFGIAAISTLLVGDEAVVGRPLDEVLSFGDSAVLVNISGHLTHVRLLSAFRSRVYIDIDPGFTQFWHALGQLGSVLDDHDQHFTIGENIGTAACSIPTGGYRWRPVRQPVVLEHWPVVPATDRERFTTVSSWRPPFGSIEYAGRTYGLKVHEFRKFLDLPRCVAADFEIALDIHPGDAADRDRLLEHGWRLVDPVAAAGTPEAFRGYVQGSAAEFSVAQGVYVDTCSGWFSDRTARYLASGRPVLVQETGFGRTLPVGAGLTSFSTIDDAARAAAGIMQDYDVHAAKARDVAEAHFCSRRVLEKLGDECGW